MAHVRPVLQRLLCSNKTVRNVPKHEVLIRWSGSGALIVKNFDTTSFSELVRSWHRFGQFFIDFRAVMKRS
jgi:hypothetical protein